VKERYHSEKLVADGEMAFKTVLGNGACGMDLINLTQDKDRWRDLVNMAMKLPLP
jgi:hypothetical protein